MKFLLESLPGFFLRSHYTCCVGSDEEHCMTKMKSNWHHNLLSRAAHSVCAVPLDFCELACCAPAAQAGLKHRCMTVSIFTVVLMAYQKLRDSQIIRREIFQPFPKMKFCRDKKEFWDYNNKDYHCQGTFTIHPPQFSLCCPNTKNTSALLLLVRQIHILRS